MWGGRGDWPNPDPVEFDPYSAPVFISSDCMSAVATLADGLVGTLCAGCATCLSIQNYFNIKVLCVCVLSQVLEEFVLAWENHASLTMYC